MATPGGASRRDVLLWAGAAVAASACSPSLPRAGAPMPSTTSLTTASPSVVPTRAVRAGLDQLSGRLTSPLVRPTSPSYASVRGLYDPRFDLRPQAVARCASPQDVAECVRFAAETGTPLHLRAGGHCYGGWSSGEGLVADVRRMARVVVDRSAGSVRIGAGALLVDVYAAVARQGRAVAAGSCPTVGVTGLTLGGGVGVLARSMGLTCDAVRSLQVVTADGTLREVDATHSPDLFWALRGGGGGLAAVTALTLAVRPAPTVQTFFLSWPGAAAEEVLSAWQGWTAGADRRLWSTCKVLAAGGALRVLVAGAWTGPAADLDAQLATLLRGLPTPRVSTRRTRTYAAAMLDEAGCTGLTPAACTTEALGPAKRLPFAATSSIVTDPLPTDGVVAAVGAARAGLEVPGVVESGLSFDALGGAVADVEVDASAFPHRHALATVQHTATWSGARSPAPYDALVHRSRAALTPWLGHGAYVNYADQSIVDFGTAYWGPNLPRLREVRRSVDPHGVFDFPQAPPR